LLFPFFIIALMAATENIYTIKIPVFEGPLDLLLHLIRENKIDIYDIPIALITRQYLNYIKVMKELNLDIAGEFLLMAATLIHIKSRMLLPVEEGLEEEAQEDPRYELVQRLLEYQTFRDASLAFREREEEWSQVFSRSPADEDTLLEREDGTGTGTGSDTEIQGNREFLPGLLELGIFDLLTAFKRLLDKASPEVVAITREMLTVKDRITFIMEKLEEREAIRFEDLLAGNIRRSYLIVTFIALLELLRLGLARAYQERDFEHIWIIRKRENRNEK
jgi:segregation and condensation protein A